MMQHNATQGSTPLENSRWEKFVLGLLDGLNQTQAYISAGYCARGEAAQAASARLLLNVMVSARLEYLKNQAASSTVMTRVELLEMLTAVARGETKDSVLSDSAELLKTPSIKDRIKAGELIGKLQGWEKQEDDSAAERLIALLSADEPSKPSYPN